MLIFIVLIFSYCTTGRERFVGKLKVIGNENVYFKIYQKDEFDMVSPLSYEIVDQKNTILSNRRFLVGTHDHIEDLEDFYSGSCGKVIYLSFIDSNRVYAIYDMNTKKVSDLSSIEEYGLLNDLRICNAELYTP